MGVEARGALKSNNETSLIFATLSCATPIVRLHWPFLCRWAATSASRALRAPSTTPVTVHRPQVPPLPHPLRAPSAPGWQNCHRTDALAALPLETPENSCERHKEGMGGVEDGGGDGSVGSEDR